MSEAETAAYTVLSGYLIFILGQFTVNFILEPIKQQKEIIGEIQDAAIYYSNVFSPIMNKEVKNEAGDKFRKLATKLVATTKSIPFYNKLRYFFGLPSLSDIGAAHHSLVGLSNSAFSGRDGYKNMEKLQKELGLYFLNE